MRPRRKANTNRLTVFAGSTVSLLTLGPLMADYYSIIADAISRRGNNDETRRRIYERARRALQERLRTLDPPISEALVANEQVALDTAICRLEANLRHDQTRN